MTRQRVTARLDGTGQPVLPPELLGRFGYASGGTVRLEEHDQGITLGRSAMQLARVYVEPTTHCNLGCATCVRNAWDEPVGWMAGTTFARVIDGVGGIAPRPTVFFGGFGEPFAHPHLLDMVAAVKEVGCRVELITNGTLLDDDTRRSLVQLGLDRLWVSIDGATPESYADVRLADALPAVIENLERLHELRCAGGTGRPRLGIAFVAMRRNIADLPALIRLGQRLGADRYSISNVLPHTAEMREEVLFDRSIEADEPPLSPWDPDVSLPRMDIDGRTIETLVAVLAGRHGRSLPRLAPEAARNLCPFVAKGSVSVRWDGAVSPCLPLLHSHRTFLDFRPRTSHAFAVGNINQRSLGDIWGDSSYVALRERLLAFDFAPCLVCNGCDMADENLEDCIGNPTPTCGGCLWAQGFIRCP